MAEIQDFERDLEKACLTYGYDLAHPPESVKRVLAEVDGMKRHLAQLSAVVNEGCWGEMERLKAALVEAREIHVELAKRARDLRREVARLEDELRRRETPSPES